MSDITVEVVNPGITVSSTQAGINIALNSGKDGDPGIGVPVGGTVGQVLSKKTTTDFDTEWVDQTGGSGGTSDHGELTGLSDDDHPQYLTTGRGDARYSLTTHNHSGVYEPAGAVSTHVANADPHTQYLDVSDIVAGTNITLSKVGNVVTINSTGSSGIPPTTIDAKGDLLVGTADDTVSRLPVGANTYVLTADSTQTAGVKWSAPTGGSGGSSTLDGLTDVNTSTAADGDTLAYSVTGTPTWIGAPTVVTYSEQYSTDYAVNAWDNVNATVWNTGANSNAWTAADFTTPKTVASLFAKAASVQRNWYLYGSSDGAVWTAIGGPFAATVAGTNYSLGASFTYRHFKFQTLPDDGQWTDPIAFTLYAPPEATWGPSKPGISPTTINAKGDLLVGTADNIVTRLGVGADGYVLTADSAQASGVRWGAAAAGGGGGGITIVQHGTDPSVVRPASDLVYWVGTATPVNALSYDLWKDN